MTLDVSPTLALPLDLVTEAVGIVATRGAGKSYASAVLIEEAFSANVPVVVIDPTGVYHGLRSSATGKTPGLPIYVLGGPHGDAPLEATAGKLIADLAADSGHSFVLDLSDLSKSQAVRFAADFLEHLYDRKARSRTTTLLVMDEAHFYAPQTPRGGFKGDSARLMGAMEDVVGLGRSRGIGVVLTGRHDRSRRASGRSLVHGPTIRKDVRMDITIRPVGTQVVSSDAPDGQTVRRLIFRDDTGQSVIIGGFSEDGWRTLVAIVNDPEKAAADAAARARIVTPPGAQV